MASISPEEFFGDLNKKEIYRYIAHGPWVPLKGSGKQYCVKCGLIALNNNFTRWSIEKGCYSELHPQFKSKRRKG